MKKKPQNQFHDLIPCTTPSLHLPVPCHPTVRELQPSRIFKTNLFTAWPACVRSDCPCRLLPPMMMELSFQSGQAVQTKHNQDNFLWASWEEGWTWAQSQIKKKKAQGLAVERQSPQTATSHHSLWVCCSSHTCICVPA